MTFEYTEKQCIRQKIARLVQFFENDSKQNKFASVRDFRKKEQVNRGKCFLITFINNLK